MRNRRFPSPTRFSATAEGKSSSQGGGFRRRVTWKGGHSPARKKPNHKVELFDVRAKGIEPIRLSAPDPKSGLSTNFNTPATIFTSSLLERIAKILHFLKTPKGGHTLTAHPDILFMDFHQICYAVSCPDLKIIPLCTCFWAELPEVLTLMHI